MHLATPTQGFFSYTPYITVIAWKVHVASLCIDLINRILPAIDLEE